MKSPFRKLLIALAIAAPVMFLGWGAGILYWHFTIRALLSTAAKEHTPGAVLSYPELMESRGASLQLMEAGCRTLPYAVNALEESKGVQYLCFVTFFIAWESIFPGEHFAEASTPELESRMDSWAIRSGDSPELQRIKCERIRLWWKDHGTEHHQMWRFWTSSCKPIEPVMAR